MNPQDLARGKIYFQYGFCDQAQTIPVVVTLKFVGKNCSSSPGLDMGEDYYVFLDPEEEYQQKIQGSLAAHGYETDDAYEDLSETIVPESSLEYVTDIDGLITLLRSVKDALS